MLKTIKNIILVDETQPLEQIKKQYKSKTYWFLGLSWLVSFLLIWIIPQNIMEYSWAKSFVDFMGYIVPMVDGLEHIRLYGPESIRLKTRLVKEGLEVLPHISFYYSVLWAWVWVSVPYMMILIKGNFRYNKDSNFGGFLQIKSIISRYNNKEFLYYFSIIIVIIATLFFYIYSDNASQKWFKILYIYSPTVGFFSSILTLGMFLSVTTYIFTYFLIKQQERLNAK